MIAKLLLICLVGKTVADGNSLIYKERTEILQTSQFCPDVQDMTKGMDVDETDYPQQSVFYLTHPISSSDPCIFEAKNVDPSDNESKIALIRAIHVDFNQWDYSGAQPCTEHINLQLSNTGVYGALPHPLCSVRKPQNISQDPVYHPMLWELARSKMGISFSILTNDSFPTGDKLVNPLPVDGDSLENKLQPQPQFIQIIFAVFRSEACSILVQQYFVEPGRNCVPKRFHTVCGVYNCSEEKAMLEKLGFWSSESFLRHEEIVKFLEVFRTGDSLDSRFIEFLGWLLPLLVFIISVYFLVACIKTLREKRGSKESWGRRKMSVTTETYMGNAASPNDFFLVTYFRRFREKRELKEMDRHGSALDNPNDVADAI